MDTALLIDIGKAIALLLIIGFGMGAKVLDPLRSSEARGRVGGTIYNTSRGTKYVKSFTSPAQPRTARQLQIRARMMIGVRAWQTLTAAQRTAWNDYAALNTEIDWTGQAQRKTGANWHARLNLRLIDASDPATADPPGVPAPDAPVAFLAANGVGSSIISWTVVPLSPLTVEVFRQGPISAGVQPKRERATLSTRAQLVTGTVTVSGLSPGTHAFFARVLDPDTGLISTYALDSAVIT